MVLCLTKDPFVQIYISNGYLSRAQINSVSVLSEISSVVYSFRTFINLLKLEDMNHGIMKNMFI